MRHAGILLRRVIALLNWYAGDIVGLCGFSIDCRIGGRTSERRDLTAEYAKRGMRCDYFRSMSTQDALGIRREGSVVLPPLFVHCWVPRIRKDSARYTLPSSRLFMFMAVLLKHGMAGNRRPAVAAFCQRRAGRLFVARCRLDKIPRHDRVTTTRPATARSDTHMLDHLKPRYGRFRHCETSAIRSKYDGRLTKRERGRHPELGGSDCDLTALGITVSLGAAELIDAEVMWKFAEN